MDFPASARFADVEGVPVVLDGNVATAFDPSPRPFPLVSTLRNGGPIDRAEFDRMVQSFQRTR